MDNLKKFFTIRQSLINFLQEDVGTGDITSNSIIPPSINVHAIIICKNNAESVVCGLEEAAIVFDVCKCNTKILVNDGSVVKKGTAVMDIYGDARSLLKAERTALNLIMRMSGIATETRKFVNAVSNFNSVRIACTRKTAPGLRYFDKKAVYLGGGDTHRMRLDDMVLIKDNHLAITRSVDESIRLAKSAVGSSIKVECEVKDLAEAIGAIRAGADIVMLDNFSPSKAAKTISHLSEIGLRKKVIIEISGGVNLRNVKKYAMAKPDIISIGYITHSSEAVDFSLEIVN